jgi:drug/metabolite transporter (DMT)-like permease
MTPAIALLAAIGSSLCNGVSTVQQKVGADKEKVVRSFDFFFLFRLIKNIPYLIGTFLEVGGYGLSLIALRILPLFLVQALIAASIIVTAFGERVLLHRHLPKKTYASLFAVLIGLALLGYGAVANHATVNNQVAKLVVEVFPIPIALLGLVFIYIRRKRLSAMILAVLGGLAFGNTSVIGRILIYPHPYWKLIENPLVWSLIASAILGQYLFSVSLQRASATQSNALMILMQTLSPTLFGLIFFGDEIKAGFQLIATVGIILVMAGSATTAIAELPEATI